MKYEYQYLTPAVARIAYEQVVAWWQAEDGKDEQGGIPDRIAPNNEIRFKSMLTQAGIDIRLLEKAGILQVERETVHNCGMTNYSRDEEHYVLDVLALYAFATREVPAPASVAAAKAFPPTAPAPSSAAPTTVVSPQLKPPRR